MPGATTRTVVLPTGTLHVRSEAGGRALDDLCAFAARENPRRGFLVVSRVLGRHIPAAPSLMRRSAHDLAALVPDDLPGPVLIVGMAETAICLGQSVHEELCRRTGRDDLFFIHSTRQRIDHPLLCRFEEPHSHASAHLIYRPLWPGFAPPRSLVLVDDELSTGTTLGNLAAALADCWPGLDRICVATLTDWSGLEWLRAMPRPTVAVALLAGSLRWEAGAAIPPTDAFDHAAGSLGGIASPRAMGRTGIAAPIEPQPETALPAGDGPLRIIGTGEFTYPAFRLAERLEAAGRNVTVQATSRSPARIGGAISTALRFSDNYGTGVPNYLYNADPADRRESWICHETGADSIDPRLIAALDARLVGWTR